MQLFLVAGKKALWKHNVHGLTPSVASAHHLLVFYIYDFSGCFFGTRKTFKTYSRFHVVICTRGQEF